MARLVGVDVGGTKVAVAVLEEGTLGGARVAQERHLVMLTVGTGIGGGIVIDGHLYRGATGAAAELGHVIVGANLEAGAPEPHGFPQPGSLERLASGHYGIDTLAAEHGL